MNRLSFHPASAISHSVALTFSNTTAKPTSYARLASGLALQFAWLWRLGLIPACRRILAIVDYRNRTCLYPVSGLILASLYFAQGYCVNHPPSLSSLKRVHPRRATSKQTAMLTYSPRCIALVVFVHNVGGFPVFKHFAYPLALCSLFAWFHIIANAIYCQ